MYYLQSRYYDPVIGRFINPDALAPASQGLTGNNMFAYGGNRVVSQKYSQAGPEGRFFFGLSNNSTTTPSTSNGGFTSSGSIARAHSFNLFGGETRWSAGWEDASAFVNTGFLRLGMSSYDTHINGRDGLIYGFAGSTVDIMNLSGVTYFAGFGVNLGGMLSAEVQVENFGLSNTVTIGRFFISGGINLAGATSITIGLNTQMPDGVVHTDAFTLGINTGMVALAAMAVYAYSTMGDPSYAYQFISNLFPSYAYLLA